MKGKKGRKKQPIKFPTPEQETWLKEYYKMFTAAVLMKKMGVGEKTLNRWMKELGLKKKRGPIVVIKSVPPPPNPPEQKQIIHFKPEVKQPRPRADHTNMSREQRIDYWINYPI